jgi:hypothetical protein
LTKPLIVLLAILLALGIVACGTPATTTPSLPSVTAAPAAVVTFADPVLEAMVRGTMGKPEGDITVAEAKSVTELNLSLQWRQYFPEEIPIKDIGGLECFDNLESLDLSFHAIIDISPLAGLKKITSLSLGGNPVTDIKSLDGLTNLKGLTLSNCAAQDYSPLTKLVNLEFLMLDHSTISDISPLASLTSLKYLYLADCPIADYSPLADLYPNLEKRDFNMSFTLAELGFIMDNGNKQATYDSAAVSVSINHSEWGTPTMEFENNSVKMYIRLDNGYNLNVIFYPDIDVYVFQMSKNNKMIMNYIYDPANGGFTFGSGDRESTERAMKDTLGETDSVDILLAPMPIFNDTIKSTFGMTANALYELPFEQAATLPPEQATTSYARLYEQLGFTADIAHAVCLYEQHKPHYISIAIHRPEWGENPNGWNVEFTDTDVNGYNLLIMYFADEGRYHVCVDKDGVDCAFDNYPATNKYGWEYPDLDTVHRMFSDAFGVPGKELYQKPLAYFKQVVQDRFGMSLDALYSLPVGQ